MFVEEAVFSPLYIFGDRHPIDITPGYSTLIFGRNKMVFFNDSLPGRRSNCHTKLSYWI
jgi:hypothetical protein